jgi:predicted Fe-Mo cluster-binding NifX family protein
MQFEAVPNGAAGAVGGAGIQAAQLIASKGANVAITGNVGPNAFQALRAAGVKIVIGVYGTVGQAVEKYKSGELKEVREPTVSGHFGKGKGTGRGRGMGRREDLV